MGHSLTIYLLQMDWVAAHTEHVQTFHRLTFLITPVFRECSERDIP